MPHPDPTPFIAAFNAWDEHRGGAAGRLADLLGLFLQLPPAAVDDPACAEGLPWAWEASIWQIWQIGRRWC
jgi:hypothetical protein